MELLTYDIPWTKSNHTPIVVAPIGDIQWAGQRGPTAKELLKSHLKRCQELNAWYVGMGDYIDFLSPSNRQRMKAAALYDTAEDVIDDKALELVHELYDQFLRPIKGRVLGCVHGHHWSQLKAGDTTDMRLCEMLGTTFLGTCAYIRLRFLYKSPAGKPEQYPVTLFVHHGVGGGGKAAGPLNKLENLLPYWDADIFLMGHSTKQATAPIQKVTPRWAGPGAPDLVHRKVYIVSTGGFARGYEHGARQGIVPMGGYVEQKMMNPAALGAPIIRIIPKVTYTMDERGKQHRAWDPEITVEL